MNKKTALITGASRGIGAAIARRLADDGYNIVLTCRSGLEQADAVAADCQAMGAETLVLSGDCSLPEVCKGWVAEAMSKFSRLDVLVHNAGITKDGLLMRMTDEQFDEVLHTNLYSGFYLSREAAKPMMKARSGRVIHISSIAGVFGNAGQVNYAASKSGIIGLAKSMAKELGSRGVTVNAVAPGVIETDMSDTIPDDIKQKMLTNISLGRMGRADEVAGLVSYLASDIAGYITGQVIVMDGGMF
ncbi:MAG: 3-oxoacyl-[acyl-carrier-protein] reductase [Oscillospiraceae bacterium]|nr:3-oxoacyl-[acyl-carrier-protein] reductase [Oscillospiraceae bacterium]